MLLHTFFCGIAVLLSQMAMVCAQVEPPGFEGSGNPVSSRDRIYTGDQTSNTITVIDPSENEVLGTISLGDRKFTHRLPF